MDCITKQNVLSFAQNKERLLALLESTLRKNAPKEKFALLFSGGIDSVLLALVLRKLGLRFKCFFGHVSGIGEPKDMRFAEEAAKSLHLELEKVKVQIEDVPSLLRTVVPLVGLASPVKIGVALPVFICCSRAGEEGFRTVFSGMGADELFCGYARFRESNDTAAYCKKTLRELRERDLPWMNAVAKANRTELRLPFLDSDIEKFALALDESNKLSRTQNKIILRSIALGLGLGKELAERKKTAAQYGSNFDKALEKLAKKTKAKGKSAYLQRFAGKKNLKIGSLFSGGKDSCLALWIMQRQNYDVKCIVSVVPENPDSFMFHKTSKSFLRLQSKALEIPLIVKSTKGEKELELAELKSALREAIEKYGIQGVVSGAMYSNYQRERIRKICTSLGLKLFSPLWHKKQGNELKELVDAGFVFVMCKIAALGLGEKWLALPMGKKEVSELNMLSEKIGFNVAGEGGEFESLVLDAPNFRKRIEIVESEKIMENEFTGFLKIKKARIKEKAGVG